MRQTTEQLDVLVYSGGFLIDAYNLLEVIRDKAAAGTAFRLLIGDSRCEAVRQRAREERLGSLVDRCRSSLEYLAEVADLPGVQIRTPMRRRCTRASTGSTSRCSSTTTRTARTRRGHP